MPQICLAASPSQRGIFLANWFTVNLDAIVAAHHGSWNETERTIMAYILANQQEVARSSVQAVAARTFTSPSSVMRLTKKLGFSGFAELKFFIRNSLDDGTSRAPVDRIELQRKDIDATLAHLGRVDLEPLVRAILDARSVFCLGTGFAQRNAIKEFSKSLLTNGIHSVVVPDLTELRVTLPMMQPGDVVVLASLSGNTPEYAELPDQLALRGVHTIAVTRLDNNIMAARSKWNIHYCATPIDADWHSGEFHSFVGLTIALDYLVRYVMNCR